MAEIFWYYARDDQQFGPVTSVELKRLASASELSPDDLVWKEGMDEWAAASKVKGLFPARDPARRRPKLRPRASRRRKARRWRRRQPSQCGGHDRRSHE